MHTPSHNTLPIRHIIGFIFSLFLTFGAMYAALYTDLTSSVIFYVILALALLQAGLQLFMFMHITESENSLVQILNIFYFFIIAATVIIGSIWVLTSM